MLYSANDIELLKIETVDNLVAHGDWMNAGWLKLIANRPRHCPLMLQVLDELQQLGIIESHDPHLEPGDVRRLDDDFRYVKHAA